MATSLKNKQFKFLPTEGVSKITLIGCGGTGSILAEHLCRMISGFKIECSLVLCDGDDVKEENITRQNFAAYEIGENKAQALAVRLSAQFGIEVGCITEHFSERMRVGRFVITATDNLISRRAVAGSNCSFWIDVGNELNHGQAVIGTTDELNQLKSAYTYWNRHEWTLELPDIAALNPKILKARKTRQKASCATVPFGEQGFGVNALAALAAATLAKQAVVDKKVRFAAIYFDVAKSRMIPRLIDRELFKAWR
jgi:hypothetical protein